MIRSNTHAFEILESPQPFIPYEAIRYLYYQTPAEDIRKKVFYWIENAYNYEVVPKESDLVIEAPIWFGIVAENYIEEALIDPVIDLYCKVNDDWDLLNEQGVVLIQKLCENLGDIAPDKYPNQILSLLETRSYWMTALLGMLPNIQFSQKKHSDLLEKIYEKLSLIQLEYETMESHDHIDASILSEIKNCQKALASSDYPNNRKITFRRGEWEAHYRKFERQRMNFYNSEDSTMPTPISIPKKVSRNAPCPCGSGKKYKHCCL